MNISNHISKHWTSQSLNPNSQRTQGQTVTLSRALKTPIKNEFSRTNRYVRRAHAHCQAVVIKVGCRWCLWYFNNYFRKHDCWGQVATYLTCWLAWSDRGPVGSNFTRLDHNLGNPNYSLFVKTYLTKRSNRGPGFRLHTVVKISMKVWNLDDLEKYHSLHSF